MTKHPLIMSVSTVSDAATVAAAPAWPTRAVLHGMGMSVLSVHKRRCTVLLHCVRVCLDAIENQRQLVYSAPRPDLFKWKLLELRQFQPTVGILNWYSTLVVSIATWCKNAFKK